MAGEFPSSAFIGRAVELRRLDAVLARTEQGSPQVVLVAGDAGVGKTRLLLALVDLAHRRGMRVLTGGCTTDPARAASAYERLGLYLFVAGRVDEALDARARAVELVPAQPPTRLRARVTAAIAMALVDARRPTEARRWCDEALAAARRVGSADEEADVMITLGVIEQYDDPAKACSLFAAARAQAADAGSPEIELRALYDLAEVSDQRGDLASACAAADAGVELAERTGLGWSPVAILVRRAQLKARYRTATGTSASGCSRPFPS